MLIPGAEWNGLPVKARLVSGIVKDSTQFPDFWARKANWVGQRCIAVEVDNTMHGGSIFYVFDEDGLGTYKVTHGGCGNLPHKHVDLDDIREV